MNFIPKFFFDPKYICSKNCCGPKISNPQKAYTFFGPKNLTSKKMLGPRNFWLKNYVSKEIKIQKSFETEKYFEVCCCCCCFYLEKWSQLLVLGLSLEFDNKGFWQCRFIITILTTNFSFDHHPLFFIGLPLFCFSSNGTEITMWWTLWFFNLMLNPMLCLHKKDLESSTLASPAEAYVY